MARLRKRGAEDSQGKLAAGVTAGTITEGRERAESRGLYDVRVRAAHEAHIPEHAGLAIGPRARRTAPTRTLAPALAALAALAVVLAAARPVAAQDVGVVVHAPAGAPASGAAIAGALARALRAGGAAPVLRPFARARERLEAGAVARSRLDGFARTRELMGQGWRAYLEARPTLAASRLGEARTRATEIVDLDGGLELYADVSLRLGAVMLALGRDDDADRDFRLAAALDPDRAVTDAVFKPAVVERYRKARSAAARPLSWRIAAEPAGAAIEIDGRAAGVAPLSVALGRGLHVVVARAPGRAARAQAIVVADGGAGGVSLVLPVDPLVRAVRAGPVALAIGRSEREAGEAARGLFLYGELDQLVVAAAVWRRGRPALIGQLCTAAPPGCGRPVEIEFAGPGALDRAAAGLVRALARAPLRYSLSLLVDARVVDREPPPAGAGGPAGGGEGSRWWRSPWVWVGASGAALAVTAVVLLLTGDNEVQPVVGVDPCDFHKGGCPVSLRW